jgi:hypothetical protein
VFIGKGFESIVEGTHVGKNAMNGNPVFEPIKTSLTGLGLELLTTANESWAVTSTGGDSTLKASTNTVACAKEASTGEVTAEMLYGNVVIHFSECKSSDSGGSNCSVKSTNTTTAGRRAASATLALLGCGRRHLRNPHVKLRSSLRVVAMLPR